MNREKITLVFDEQNLNLCFFGKEEAVEKKPNFIKFSETSDGKRLMAKEDNILKDGNLFLKPFKILITKKVDDFFKTKHVSFIRGKIDMNKILVLYPSEKIAEEDNLFLGEKDLENLESLMIL